MKTDSRIYIAGHRGLVGSSIVRHLERNAYTNLITATHAELDLLDSNAVEQFFTGHKPEYVFLAAATVGGIMANKTYPADFIYNNLQIQSNIIHTSHKHDVTRLIFLGSSCIYPKDCPQPMREDYLLSGELESTNRPYAVAKIAGIEMCWSYNRQYNTQYIAVMPTNSYGANDNFDLNKSHVLPAIIRKCHLAKLAAAGDWPAIEHNVSVYGDIPADVMADLKRPSPRVRLWGTGKARREFLHAYDMADACIYLANLEGETYQSLITSDQQPPLINIGCGQDQSIAELADLIKQTVGFAGEIAWDTDKPDGTPQKLLDVSRINTLGWQPGIALPEGIQSAYQDYLGNL